MYDVIVVGAGPTPVSGWSGRATARLVDWKLTYVYDSLTHPSRLARSRSSTVESSHLTAAAPPGPPL
jgi:hypothetical protein